LCRKRNSGLVRTTANGVLIDAERLGGLEIDDRPEFGGLLDRNIARFRTFKILVHEIGGGAAVFRGGAAVFRIARKCFPGHLPPTNQLESFMRHLIIATAVGGSALLAAVPVSAQTQPAASPPSAPPPFATTKVEGTDNVYIFRYQGHQSMFVVTPDGVIAPDPIGLGRPQAVTTYIDEIKKVTSQPI